MGDTKQKPKTTEPETAKPSRAAMSPQEWADIKFPADAKKKGRRPIEYGYHAGATVLHGWTEHAHHENGPIQLSEADYEKAVEAAQKPNPKPHRAACSKHHPATKRAAEQRGSDK